MEVLRILLAVICIVILALCGEKAMHVDEKSLENLTMYLLYDVKSIVKGLFKFTAQLFQETKTRHIFDDSLAINFRKTVEDYVAKGFEVECCVQIDNDRRNPIRYISIRFPVKRSLSEEELSDLAYLELEQFKRYLYARGLFWKSFSAYDYDKRCLHIMLYYAEFPEEEAYLLHKYEVRIKENMPWGSGTLCDDELEKELKNVN